MADLTAPDVGGTVIGFGSGFGSGSGFGPGGVYALAALAGAVVGRLQ